MRKSIHLLTWIMLAAMMFSICGCAGSGMKEYKARPITGNEVIDAANGLTYTMDQKTLTAEKIINDMFGVKMEDTSSTPTNLTGLWTSYKTSISFCGIEFERAYIVTNEKEEVYETGIFHDCSNEMEMYEVFESFETKVKEALGKPDSKTDTDGKYGKSGYREFNMEDGSKLTIGYSIYDDEKTPPTYRISFILRNETVMTRHHEY